MSAPVLDLSKLTPRTRIITEMAMQGISAAETAERLGITKQGVYSRLHAARVALGTWFRTKGRPASDADAGDETSPRDHRARIAREIAEGKRCAKCWLLLPCDHA